jgi:hypothetical protein
MLWISFSTWKISEICSHKRFIVPCDSNPK